MRFPVGKIHEDEYTAHQFYWQCERITIAAKPLYFYVQRGGSIIHTDSPQKTMDLAEGIFQRADRIKFRLFLCSPTLYRAALLTKSWMNKIGF